MRHKIMWFARLADSNLLSISVVTFHWNRFFDLAMLEMFSKVFSYRKSYHSDAKNVISIIVIGYLMSPQTIIYTDQVLATFLT